MSCPHRATHEGGTTTAPSLSPVTRHDTQRARFLAGLAATVDLDPSTFVDPGVTPIGRDDRADSGAAACYSVDDHLLVWADPAVVDAFAPLAERRTAPTADELFAFAETAGFEFVADATMRLLADDSLPEPATLPDGLAFEALDPADPATLERVTAFTESCDPDDVEEAALDELDDFQEFAIRVISDRSGRIVAWASAAPWDWDEPFGERRFGDIGVLVAADARGKGLGRAAVVETARALLAEGVEPLYRQTDDNLGSAALARSLGFTPVTTLRYFKR